MRPVLFAILAGVRNGYGFAGCDTGDGFRPIAPPRGLPGDVSPEVAEEARRWTEAQYRSAALETFRALAPLYRLRS